MLLENLLRHEDGTTVKKTDIAAFADWLKNGGKSAKEINFRPARVLMQDFTGVPAVVDLAAMRDAMGKLGGDAKKINPLVAGRPRDRPFGDGRQLRQHRRLRRQRRRSSTSATSSATSSCAGARWRSTISASCRRAPASATRSTSNTWRRSSGPKKEGKETIAYPDTLVGTDSHTTMVNGLAVLGWGVGGIEAEAAMLGQPISMLIPEVVGFKLTGKLREGATATDLVLTVTQMLRKKGVVNKFVEFYGEGLDDLPLADRATIANMAPEYGATCGFFPVDEITLGYLKTTNRGAGRQARRGLCQEAGPVALQEVARAGLHRHAVSSISATVEPSLAGPKRPQDRVPLSPGRAAVRRQHGEGVRPQGRRQARRSARAPTTISAMATW